MAPAPTIDLDTLSLDRGCHTGPEAGGCVMEWVSALAGEPWSDHPACTSPVIAAYVRILNDEMSDTERQCLVAYIPRLVGTTATPQVEVRRAYMAADTAVRVFAPAGLRAAGITEQAERLAGLPEIVDVAAAWAARAAAATAEAGEVAGSAAWAARAAAAAAAAAEAGGAAESSAWAARAAAAAEAAARAAEAWDEALRLVDRLIEAEA